MAKPGETSQAFGSLGKHSAKPARFQMAEKPPSTDNPWSGLMRTT